MSEDAIQAKFFQRVWNELPQTRRLFFSIPNGSSRDIREAVKLKATGLVAGEPDMCLIWDGKAYGFELKTETGTLSKAQEKVHEAWNNANAPVFLVRDPDQGFELVKSIVMGVAFF